MTPGEPSPRQGGDPKGSIKALWHWYAHPDALHAAPEKRYRTDLTVRFSVIGALVAFLYAAVYVFHLGYPVAGWALGGAGVLLVSMPIILRRAASHALGGHLIAATTIALSWYLGALRETFPVAALMYATAAIVVTYHLAGRWPAVAWTAIASAGVILFTVLEGLGLSHGVFPAPPSAILLADAVGLVFLFVVILQISGVIERAGRSQAQLRAQLEGRIGQTRRLESLRMFASGVAHGVNNPLAAIVGNLRHIERQLTPHQPTADLTDAIEDSQDAAERIRLLIIDLGRLAQINTPMGETTAAASSPSLVPLRSILDAAINLTRTLLEYRARVTVTHRADAMIAANPGELGEAFVNLLVNAAEAVPEGHTDEHEIVITSGFSNGEAIIEIRDTGRGIPNHLKSRIFEPFFTTKEVGSGQGLGLSLASGLVESVGGRIEVTGGEGRGSTFRVLLPAEAPQTEVEVPGELETTTVTDATSPVERRWRVLLIDDDRLVARALRYTFEPEHDVVTCDSATAGREVLEQHSDQNPFDTIVCDLVMPDFNGMDLYEWAEQHQPATAARMLFITGGAISKRSDQFILTHEDRIVFKPLEGEELLGRIAQLLRDLETSP